MSERTTPDPIQKRPFGQTDLLVTPIGVGAAPLGSMPATFAYAVPEDQALATVRAMFDSPINFLDTAAIYGYDSAAPHGFGESERRIGMVIRERGGLPPGFVLATKADRDPRTNDFSPDQMKRSVEGSLQRLGLDRLQVCYLHDPEYGDAEGILAPGGGLETLIRYREQGVIEHLGIAGGPIDLMIRFVEVGVFEAVISHNRYTLLNREADPLFDIAARRGMAVVNAAPYGSGMLAKGPSAYPRYMYGEASEELLEKARRMEAACARHGVPLAAAALQFSLRDPRITSTVVGMTRPERIQQTIELALATVPDELWGELEEIAGTPRG